MRRRYSLTDDTPRGQGKAMSAMVRTVAVGILVCSLLALVGDSSYAGSSPGIVAFARCPSCDSSFTNELRSSALLQAAPYNKSARSTRYPSQFAQIASIYNESKKSGIQMTSASTIQIVHIVICVGPSEHYLRRNVEE